MPKPEEYKHIRAWGRFMHSMPYYIRDQQYKASQDNAPIDAIYERNGQWFTYREVENAGTKLVVDRILETL